MSVSQSFFADRRDTTPRGWTFVFAAWLLATVSTLGALFLSEVVGVAPCTLCWYQRVFMFPLVFVLASGLFPLDRRVFRYAFPLVIGGWLVALFHVLLTQGVIPHELSPCVRGIPCSQVEVVWFGFVTIPLLSIVSFTALGAALVAARLQTPP